MSSCHHHSVIPPPRSDRQAAAPTMVGAEESAVPVAAAPAGQTGEKKALPRIVAGVDGSPASVEALRWAARQADLTGAAVEAVISWDYPSTSGMEFGLLDIDWAGNARAALADALHVALGNDASRVTQAVTRGHPAVVLVAAAQGAPCSSSDPAATWRCPAGCSARSANTSPPAPRARSWWSARPGSDRPRAAHTPF